MGSASSRKLDFGFGLRWARLRGEGGSCHVWRFLLGALPSWGSADLAGREVLAGVLVATAKLRCAGSGWCLFMFEDYEIAVKFSLGGWHGPTAFLDAIAKLWCAVARRLAAFEAHDATGECLRIFEGHEVASLGAGGQRVFAVSLDATAKLWCAGSGECVRAFDGCGSVAEVWFDVLGECLSSFEGHDVVPVSAGGQRVRTVSADATVGLWCAVSGECLFTFEGQGCTARPCFAVSLIASVDATVRLWYAVSGESLVTFEGQGCVTRRCCAVSGECSRTLEGHGCAAKLCCAVSGECLRTVEGFNKSWLHAMLCTSGGGVPDADITWTPALERAARHRIGSLTDFKLKTPLIRLASPSIWAFDCRWASDGQ